MDLQQSQIFILVCVVILIVLVLVIIVSARRDSPSNLEFKVQSLAGNVETLDLDWCLSKSLPSLSCYGQGSLIVYQRPVFHHLQPINHFTVSKIEEQKFPGWYLGAHAMKDQDAILICGKIPTECLYWGITGYLYDRDGVEYFTPIGDTISSFSIKDRSPRNGVAVIMTSNRNMYESVKTAITTRWNAEHKPYSLNVFPIFITEKMNRGTSRFTMMIETVLDHSSHQPPQWETFAFRSLEAPVRPVFDLDEIDRSSDNPETRIQSFETWRDSGAHISQQLPTIREIPVAPYLEGPIPGGFDKGRDALRHHVSARGISRDITEFTTGAIELTRGEKLVVIANDHTTTRKASLSLIAFKDANKDYTFETQVIGTHLSVSSRPLKKGELYVRVVECNPWKSYLDDRIESLRLEAVERIYCDPHTDGTGPNYSSVLPMIVYVVKA